MPTLEAKASNKLRVKFSDDQSYYTQLAAVDDTINWQGEVDKNHPRFLAKMDGHDFQACLRLAHSLHLWSQSVPGRMLNVVVDYATTVETRAEVRDCIEPYKTFLAGPEDRAEDLPPANDVARRPRCRDKGIMVPRANSQRRPSPTPAQSQQSHTRTRTVIPSSAPIAGLRAIP